MAELDGKWVNLTEAGQSGVVFASTARTATVNSADIYNDGYSAMTVVIDCSAIVSSPSVVFTIQGKDAVSGNYYTVLASAAIIATGTTVLRVFRGATAAANTVANYPVPSIWRVNAVHGNSNSITYSVSVDYHQ